MGASTTTTTTTSITEIEELRLLVRPTERYAHGFKYCKGCSQWVRPGDEVYYYSKDSDDNNNTNNNNNNKKKRHAVPHVRGSSKRNLEASNQRKDSPK